MLQPPGSTSHRPRPSTSSRRAQKVETPDDIIRQLQKLPANKRCADCSSKLPSCVNLTVGSFVCMACAGIHRELSQRVKGVGHSKFTQEEVDRLKTTDNDKVNLVWLARYNPQRERMKPPTDNTDQNKLKSWIRRKYSDKAWYASANNAQQQQPTMVQMPPKQQQQQQQSRQAPPQQQQAPVDLFADFTTPAPAAQGGWDAFGGGGGGQPQQQQQQAGFANFNQAPTPAADAFPADFGSSQLKQQHGNTFPPPPQQQQGGFANFQAPPSPHRGAGFANFGGQQPQQPQQQPPPQQQHQQGGFANFGQQPQMQQQQPPQMQQQQPPQQGGFANFGQPQMQGQQSQAQQQGQQTPQKMQQQQPYQMQQQQGGFANFGQQQQQPPQMQQPQGGFANFGQQPQQMQQPPQQQMQQQPPQVQQQTQQGGFANFAQPQLQGQQPPQMQQQPQQVRQAQPGGFDNFGQPQMQQQQPPQLQPAQSQQQQPPPQQQQQNFSTFGAPQGGVQNFSAGLQQQQTPSTPQGNFGSSQPTNQSIVNGMPPTLPSLQSQNVPQTVSTENRTPADAISAISVEIPAASAPAPAPQPAPVPKSAGDAISSMNFDSMNLQQPSATNSTTKDTPKNPPLQKGESRYQKGQRVIYKSASYVGAAKVVKVHFDDELEPFYTIEVNGKEKQTDDAHLEAHSPLHDEVENLIHALSEEDLAKVKVFVENLKSSSPSPQPTATETPTPAQFQHQNNGKMSSPQLGGLPSLGGHPLSQGPPTGMQQQQQQHMPPSNQQGMQQAGTMNPQGQHTLTNTSQHSGQHPPSVPSQQSQPNVQQFGNAQQPSQAFGGMPNPQGMQQTGNMQQPGHQPPPNMSQQGGQQAPNGAPQPGQSGFQPGGSMHQQSQPNGMMQVQPTASAPVGGGGGLIPSPNISGPAPAVSMTPEAFSKMPAPPLSQGQQQQAPNMQQYQQQQQAPQQQYQQFQQGGGYQQQPPQQQMQAQAPQQQMQQSAPPQAPMSPKGNPFDFY